MQGRATALRETQVALQNRERHKWLYKIGIISVVEICCMHLKRWLRFEIQAAQISETARPAASNEKADA